MRGEYQDYDDCTHYVLGSPPLARGVLSECENTLMRARITPACAGSTAFKDFVYIVAEDHPRLRGEYTSVRTEGVSFQGSPPLARGVHGK